MDSDDAAERSPKVTGAGATEGASAVTRVTPSVFCSRTKVSAWPLASVTAAAVESCAPLDASKVTAAPTTGSPAASRSATRSDSGSSAPGGPVWLSPCTLRRHAVVIEAANGQGAVGGAGSFGIGRVDRQAAALGGSAGRTCPSCRRRWRWSP